MNKTVQLTVSILIAISGSMAFAVGTAAHEVNSRIESDVTKRTTERQSQDASKKVEQVRSELSSNLSDVTQSDLAPALANSTIKLQNGKSVDMVGQARTILATKQSLKEMNRNEMDAEGQAAYDLKLRAVKATADFLASASLPVTDSPVPRTKKIQQAYASEIDSISKMLTSWSGKELESHISLMENSVKKTSREGNVVDTFGNLLAAKYADKFEQKLDEIIGCQK